MLRGGRLLLFATAASRCAAQQDGAVAPNWRAGRSVCPSLPNFETADLFPIRSPLMVADYLATHVKGKAFCEIGTRNGDVMGCVSHFAKSVTAIEMDQNYCNKLRKRGFGVACKPFERIGLDEFPTADVYYWWPSDAGAPRGRTPRATRHAPRAARHV